MANIEFFNQNNKYNSYLLNNVGNAIMNKSKESFKALEIILENKLITGIDKALILATIYDALNIFKLIINKTGYNIIICEHNFLKIALNSKSCLIFRYLIRIGYHRDITNLLSLAIEKELAEEVNIILRHGAKISENIMNLAKNHLKIQILKFIGNQNKHETIYEIINIIKAEIINSNYEDRIINIKNILDKLLENEINLVNQEWLFKYILYNGAGEIYKYILMEQQNCSNS